MTSDDQPIHWLTIAEWNATAAERGVLTIATASTLDATVRISAEPDPITGQHWIQASPVGVTITALRETDSD